MYLLEFLYWSDVVMWAVLVTLVFSVLIFIKISKKTSPISTDQISGFISSFKLYEGKQLIFSITGKLNIMALELLDSQQADGVLSFVDKKGAPTDVPDGNVVITSSDTNVATVSYKDDGNVVTVVAGLPGVAALHFDVKDSKGNALPFEDVAVEVKSGDAVSGSVAFGAPTEQP